MPSRLGPLLDLLAAHGVESCLTGGLAVDAWTRRRRRHGDVDLLVAEAALDALRRLGAARGWPLEERGDARSLGTPAGPCDLLVVRRGADGLWRPAWQRGRVPWPAGEPFGHAVRIAGRPVAAAPPTAMLLRLRADTPELPKARREAALLAPALGAGAAAAVEAWLRLHLPPAGT